MLIDIFYDFQVKVSADTQEQMMCVLRKTVKKLSLYPSFTYTIEPHHEKTNNVVSEQFQHKPSCTSAADG